MKTTESYTAQLGQFIRYVLLPAVPRLAWWALGLLGFSWLNLLLLAELWPHHPQAETWFAAGFMLCLALLPWLGVYTAQRLISRVRRWWWRSFWRLVTIGGYLAGVVALFALLIGVMVSS
ncbi:hypothetical protein [Hymenobacter actinosclerus]|uniref:Uncharacterized protein n=1 Tax=Hymenobacter actinosclerus TaxID=82805 RepID=A0A1I0AIR4_9BACT|nr:hypothetical protein [Hymenobacter actinosclerus]SES94176.1 hypothetical protein SAMN04487998_0734 [Hymenobacter actinosclerus]